MIQNKTNLWNQVHQVPGKPASQHNAKSLKHGQPGVVIPNSDTPTTTLNSYYSATSDVDTYHLDMKEGEGTIAARDGLDYFMKGGPQPKPSDQVTKISANSAEQSSSWHKHYQQTGLIG
eukprot:TRINITY_DN580_c0_g1_i1.p1 TRINITY_DN580_c0_g1~~TRINITY_DN580_c0_g1_i1.p1  ORF type:complete len:119 (-),score=13.75 TRINITY_DN580_c0_g1_i1:49-405(-)